MYWAKLSIPGKQNAELSYVFADELDEQKNSSVLLFGVFDVKTSSEIYLTIIKQTVKHFLDFYHSVSPFDSVASEEMPDSTEFIFEHSIQYTYEKVSDALQDFHDRAASRQTIDIRRINCILGALIDDTLYLSLTGSSIQPLLIYPVSHSRGPGPVHYVLMNIAESGGAYSGEPHTRLFSQLINGSVAIPSSCIMLCNQTFLDYISPSQIKQVLSNSKPQNVLPYFEHLLSRVHARNDFSALLIARDEQAPERQRQRSAAPASSLSMKDLNGTAESTRSILSPTMRPYFSRAIRGLLALFIKGFIGAFHIVKRLYSYLTAPEQVRAYRRVARTIFAAVKTSEAGIPKAASRFAKKTASLSTALSDGSLKNHLIRALKACYEKIFVNYAALRSWFFSLNTLSRALFMLSIIFISLFIVSLLSIQFQNSSNRKESRMQEILAAVEQKIIAADARLIYDDRTRAQELIQESRQLLALIDERLKTSDGYQKILSNTETLELKINNITNIEEPTLLGSIPETPEKPAGYFRILSAGATIILYTDDTVYAYVREKKELSELGLHEKIPNISCATAATQKEFYFCNADGSKIYALSFPDKTVHSFSFAKIGENTPDAILTYNSRLYSFYRQSGSLLRFAKKGQSYTAGAPWLRGSPEDIALARDIAIDGLVYILTKDGVLQRFRSGVRIETDIPRDTAVALAGATRIITNSDATHLFALDTVNKKIIAVEKQTFALVEQITSPAFQKPSDIALSNKQNIILLADSGRLYSIPFSLK